MESAQKELIDVSITQSVRIINSVIQLIVWINASLAVQKARNVTNKNAYDNKLSIYFLIFSNRAAKGNINRKILYNSQYLYLSIQTMDNEVQEFFTAMTQDHYIEINWLDSISCASLLVVSFKNNTRVFTKNFKIKKGNQLDRFLYFERFSDFVNFMKDVSNYRIDLQKKDIILMWKFVSNSYNRNIQTIAHLEEVFYTPKQMIECLNKIVKAKFTHFKNQLKQIQPKKQIQASKTQVSRFYNMSSTNVISIRQEPKDIKENKNQIDLELEQSIKLQQSAQDKQLEKCNNFNVKIKIQQELGKQLILHRLPIRNQTNHDQQLELQNIKSNIIKNGAKNQRSKPPSRKPACRTATKKVKTRKSEEDTNYQPRYRKSKRILKLTQKALENCSDLKKVRNQEIPKSHIQVTQAKIDNIQVPHKIGQNSQTQQKIENGQKEPRIPRPENEQKYKVLWT